MVSFITFGTLFVSIFSLVNLVNTVPSINSEGVIVPHVNSITTKYSFKRPPIITRRTQFFIPLFKGDHDAEAKSIEKNKKRFTEHDDSPETIKSEVIIASAAQIANLKLYAGLAASAYCRGVVPFGIWNCKNCLKYVPDGKLIVTSSSFFADTSGLVLRSVAQKTIHLVFRGSNSIRNAIIDIQYDLVDYPPVRGAKVLRGFLEAYGEVVGTFFPAVQKQISAYPTYKVVVSGHSLGGSLALLAGIDFYQRISSLSPSNLSIYTFGGPRVGDPTFAYYIDSTGIPIIRSVNKRDLVAHIPPQVFGYLHAGVEVWTKSSTNVQICVANIETNDCSNSIVPFISLVDHLSYYGINEGLCL